MGLRQWGFVALIVLVALGIRLLRADAVRDVETENTIEDLETAIGVQDALSDGVGDIRHDTDPDELLRSTDGLREAETSDD